jgi:hypothetical protein
MRSSIATFPRVLTRGALMLCTVMAAFACAATSAGAVTGLSIVTPAAASTVTSSPPLLDWTVTGAPAFSDVQCRADGHAWTGCSDNDRFYEVQANGAHTIDVRVRDKTVPEPYPIAATASVTFTLNDTTAPLLNFVGFSPGATLTDSDISPDFTSDDAAAQFNCALDGWVFGCNPSNLNLEYITNGPHTVKINATDLAGNASSLNIPFTMNDTTSPTVSITSPSGTYTDSSWPPDIAYTATDEYDAQCGYDDQPVNYCSPYNKPSLGNGVHTARVVISDRAGNSATDAVNFTINDVTPPSFTVTKPIEGEIYTTFAQAVLAPNDEHARHYASFDDSGMKLMQNSNPVIWNFPNAAAGAHTVQFTAIDGAGNRSTQLRHITFGDTTDPTIDTISPTNGSTINYNQGGAGYTSNDSDFGVCKFDVGPPFPCQSSNTYPLSGLAPGAHSFTVIAYDQVGNASDPTTTSFTMTANSTGSMTLQSPTNQAYTAQPILRFPPGVTNGLCRLNGGDQFYCYDGLQLTTGNGNWTLEAIGFDSPNVYTTTVSFTTADVTPPALAVTYPQEGGTVQNTREFAPFVYTTDYDAENKSISSSESCKLDGGAEIGCNEVATPYAPLQSGAHTLIVIARDWAGNAATQVLHFTVTDSTGPTIKILSPLPAATVGSGGPQLLFWSDDDDADYKCHVDSRPATNCSPGNGWTPSPAGPSPIGPLGNGPHTLTVTGKDSSGNVTTQSVAINIADLTAPTLTIAENPGDTRSNLPSITWGAGEPIVKVRCWIGATPVSYIAEPGCALDSQHQSGSYAPSAPVTGTWTIEATDAAGNAATASIAITVNDTKAPVITIQEFVPLIYNQDVNDESPVGVQFVVDDAVAAYKCSLDGGAETVCSPPLWNFNALPTGAHTLQIKGTDGSNNTATASTPFTVTDTTPPALSIKVGGSPPTDGMTLPAAFSAEATTQAGSALSSAQDGGDFTDFAGTTANFSFTSGGAHTASVRSTDPSGNSTTRSFIANIDPSTVPPQPRAEPGATPPPLSAKIAKIKPKFSGKNVLLPIKLTVTLPSGVPLTAACAGKAAMQGLVGKKSVGKASAALKVSGGKCTAAGTLKLKRKSAAGKKVAVNVTFAGNAASGGFTSKTTVKVPKR